MAPLATVAISGLPPRSAAYKHLAALLETRGCDVAPYGAHLAGSAPDFAAPLVGGAGVGVLMARGDVLFGAAGTVTWNDGDRVVMFGHPFYGDGDVQYYMTAAVVNGVWSSNMDAYKLMTPGAVRGSVLQDRGSGVAGRLGDMPLETPVTGSVELRPQGVVGRETVVHAAAPHRRRARPDGRRHPRRGRLQRQRQRRRAGQRGDHDDDRGLRRRRPAVHRGPHDTWDDSYDVLGYAQRGRGDDARHARRRSRRHRAGHHPVGRHEGQSPARRGAPHASPTRASPTASKPASRTGSK